MHALFRTIFKWCYRYLAKPLFFRLDPEKVHNHMVHMGEQMGTLTLVNKLLAWLFGKQFAPLHQTIADLSFLSPIGLAAGYDYEARLTQILPSLGFGFQSIGTITNSPYTGNPKPMLGRLPKSRSLMVNKGYKNPGVRAIVKKLEKLSFTSPVGISIGKTNSAKLTQEESVKDILSCFMTVNASSIKHSYYELNISCPNLYGDVTFYTEKTLNELLSRLEKVKIQKPLFIKMPIDKDNKTTHMLLEVIAKYSFVTGVIIGNLQKNRKDPALIQSEVAKFTVGNFSGKPTWKRSNELIALTYKHFAKRFIIIGCGGVFSAEDAYTKICLGSTLVQLITGMIFEGPQLISEINEGLTKILKENGYTHISQAIGSGLTEIKS